MKTLRKATVDMYKKMLTTLDIEKCSCANEGEVGVGSSNDNLCNWPNLHTDIKELVDKGTYRGVPMGHLVADTNRTREGHSQQLQNFLLDKDIVKVLD